MPLPIQPNGGPLEIQYGQLFAIALILSLGWFDYGVKLGGNVRISGDFLKTGVDRSHHPRRFGARQAARGRTTSVAPLTFHGLHRGAGGGVVGVRRAGTMSAWSLRKSKIRNLPRALIGGTLCVVAIYMLANAAYFHVMASANSWQHKDDGDNIARSSRLPARGGFHNAAMISIFAALQRFHIVRCASALRRRPRRLLFPTRLDQDTRSITLPMYSSSFSISGRAFWYCRENMMIYLTWLFSLVGFYTA